MPSTFLERIYDQGLEHFKQPPQIITDAGIPIYLSVDPKGFFVYTPFLTTCGYFGSKYQASAGSYLCHGGRSKQAVKQPWIGQSISFCDQYGHITNTTQKIVRIYRKPLQNMIPHLGSYINMFYMSLSETKNPIPHSNLHILTEVTVNSPYNKFLNSVFCAAVYGRTNGWIIDTGKSFVLKELDAPALGIDINLLFQSHLINKTDSGEIEISNAFVALLLNAINNCQPDATHFNEDGLLLVN